jgi:two-component system, OmpR family, sensor kinase
MGIVVALDVHRSQITFKELREAIRSATEESDRLAQLAEDLLLVAQTDQGRLPLNIERLPARQLLDTIAARYRWRAEDASLQLITETPPGLSLDGDRIRLEQALGNLVDNAIRHADHTVSLSARGNHGTIELHVQDDGTGFAPTFIDHAFERFSRADTARGRGGIGLGLSIVQAIAHAHGGAPEQKTGTTAAPTSGSPSRSPTQKARRPPRRRPSHSHNAIAEMCPHLAPTMTR